MRLSLSNTGKRITLILDHELHDKIKKDLGIPDSAPLRMKIDYHHSFKFVRLKFGNVGDKVCLLSDTQYSATPKSSKYPSLRTFKQLVWSTTPGTKQFKTTYQVPANAFNLQPGGGIDLVLSETEEGYPKKSSQRISKRVIPSDVSNLAVSDIDYETLDAQIKNVQVEQTLAKWPAKLLQSFKKAEPLRDNIPPHLDAEADPITHLASSDFGFDYEKAIKTVDKITESYTKNTNLILQVGSKSYSFNLPPEELLDLAVSLSHKGYAIPN